MERELHLLVILLALLHLTTVPSNAIPATRAQRLLQETRDLQALGDTLQIMSTTEEGTEEEVIMRGRMDLESNDYPGSGANNRHTPKPPGRK